MKLRAICRPIIPQNSSPSEPSEVNPTIPKENGKERRKIEEWGKRRKIKTKEIKYKIIRNSKIKTQSIKWDKRILKNNFV